MFITAFFAALALLSGNPKGQTFPEASVPRIDTGASIAWITEGEFASNPHFVATALDAAGRSRLLNGHTHGDGNAMVFGKWGAGRQKASFVVDLKSLFLVRKVTLWSAEEKAIRGCESFTVALSRDGTNFTQLAQHVNPVDFAAGQGGPHFTCSPLDCELGKDAREYVAYPLRPGVERHYAVTAVYPTGECPKVRSVAHRPIGPLEVTRFRDMLGFNFFYFVTDDPVEAVGVADVKARPCAATDRLTVSSAPAPWGYGWSGL